MRIKVEDEAKKKILQTARYIQQQFGTTARVAFRNEIRLVVDILRVNPNLGPIEPLLADAPVSYRSIVVRRLNKIIYWINGDVIEIVDFWDCRREPKSQAAQTLATKTSSPMN